MLNIHIWFIDITYGYYLDELCPLRLLFKKSSDESVLSVSAHSIRSSEADCEWYSNTQTNQNFCFTETAPSNGSWGLCGEGKGGGGVCLCSTTADCGLDSFFPNQITFVSWFGISMQQAWENDKLLLPLSWQLKKWLLWGSRVHRRRKAKTLSLSSVWHLLFNIQNCIIMMQASWPAREPA